MIILLIIIIILLLILIQINKQNGTYGKSITYRKDITENWDSVLDTLNIPENPEVYNEVETRRLIRLIGIEYNAKLDKYNNIEKISYKKPEPELGETNCDRIKCPQWISNVVCWKCE